MTLVTGKNIARIGRERLTRVFIGTHSQKVSGYETWFELGHFYEGVESRIRKITEKNGVLRELDAECFVLEWTGELAQNTLEDLDLYEFLNGPERNVALLTGNKLRLFRMGERTTGNWFDNRVSVTIEEGYSRQDKSYIRIGGFIWGYEIAYVKSVAIVSSGGGRNVLSFDKSKIRRRGTWDSPGATPLIGGIGK
jgi:hypothetical protein